MQTAPTSTRISQPASLPTAATDAELVERAAKGDDSAFERIMRKNNRLLFRTARSILKSDAEAEDALQEAYLRAWRALSTFRADSKLSTWLVRIVINEALGRLRRRKGAQVIPLESVMESFDRQPQESSEEDDPNREPDRLAMRSQVRRLMEARIDLLPEAFRTVFMLRAVEELSVEEVAAALEIPEATVRTRFFRARSLLREGLSRDVDLVISDAFSFDGGRCDRIVANVLTKLAEEPGCFPVPLIACLKRVTQSAKCSKSPPDFLIRQSSHRNRSSAVHWGCRNAGAAPTPPLRHRAWCPERTASSPRQPQCVRRRC